MLTRSVWISCQHTRTRYGPTVQIGSTSVTSDRVLLTGVSGNMKVCLELFFYQEVQQQQLFKHAFFFFFFWNFSCRVHIMISRQMKCETYRIFKSVFNLRVLDYTQNLFKYFKLDQNTLSIFRVLQASWIMIVFK